MRHGQSLFIRRLSITSTNVELAMATKETISKRTMMIAGNQGPAAKILPGSNQMPQE